MLLWNDVFVAHLLQQAVKGSTMKGQKAVARARNSQPIIPFSVVMHRTHVGQGYFSVDVSDPHVQHFLRLVAMAQRMIDSERPQRQAS